MLLRCDNKELLIQAQVFFNSELVKYENAYGPLKHMENKIVQVNILYDQNGRVYNKEDFCTMCGEVFLWTRAVCDACNEGNL